MWMGRWSELKAVTVDQELQGRMDGEAKLMSGEELQCLVLRVGVSRFRMPKLLLESQSMMLIPLASSLSCE